MREQQAKAEKRKALLVKLGLVAVVVVIIAVVAVIAVQNNRNAVADAGPAPQGGNAEGGIALVSETEFSRGAAPAVDVATLGPEPEPGEPTPRGVARAAAGDPAQVVLYVDVNCVHCADFEDRYAEQLRTWLGAGDITLEYRNLSLLASPTNYSARGANALSCVADAAPASYLPYAEAVFAHYPEGEMDNGELAQLARDNGAEVDECIEDGTFRPFAQFTQEAATRDRIPGTPSVWVQGQVWDPEAEPDFSSWAQGLIDAA